MASSDDLVLVNGPPEAQSNNAATSRMYVEGIRYYPNPSNTVDIEPMVTAAACWKNAEVTFKQERCAASIRTGSVEDIARHFSKQIEMHHSCSEKHDLVFQLQADWTLKNGCSLEVTAWDPYACQGRCWASFELRFRPWNPQETITWSRAASYVPARYQHDSSKHIAQGFDALFHILLSSGNIKILGIKSLGHDWASQILYWKLVNNPKISHLEFQNHNGKADDQRRMMNFCCKLLRNSSGLKRVLFERLRTYSEPMVQRMFESMECNTSLDTLDLRTSRRIDTWDKKRSRGRDGAEKGLSITPLVQALTNSSPNSTLKQLYLAGMLLSSESVVALAKSLPQRGIEKLMLRDTGHNEDVLIQLIQSLKHDKSLKELDISLTNSLCRS
jgi:hypothetical protein